MKPPAHPNRFVSPADTFATTDMILKSVILVALLGKAFFDGHSWFDEGFDSLPDILGTGAGQALDLSHDRGAKKVFFWRKKSQKLKRG